MYGYIYKTTDKLTGKIYIGKHRAKCFEGYRYIGSGLIISNIKEKLLKDNIKLDERFDIEMIDSADSKEELNIKEVYWIDFLNARDYTVGYNIAKGGEGGIGGPMFTGHSHSEDTKKKMSLSRRGENNANFGNRWNQSIELRELHSKLSSGSNNSMFGKKQSKESNLKNRQSHLGKIAISNVAKDQVKMIYANELYDYLQSGWIKGNIHTHRNV